MNLPEARDSLPPLGLRLSEGLGHNAALVASLRALARHEHSDASIGDDAADAIEQLHADLLREHADHAQTIDDAATVAHENTALREALAQSGKLADDRLQQMNADRAQALRWRDQLDRALTVCRCAARVIDSSAYQGISDEDCDLEVAVRNWRALGPNVRAKLHAEACVASPVRDDSGVGTHRACNACRSVSA